MPDAAHGVPASVFLLNQEAANKPKIQFERILSNRILSKADKEVVVHEVTTADDAPAQEHMPDPQTQMQDAAGIVDAEVADKKPCCCYRPLPFCPEDCGDEKCHCMCICQWMVFFPCIMIVFNALPSLDHGATWAGYS